ncbi:30S ribosomal protein S7, partial [Patescibacteria group bacterium]|nr:30S ribosomal protein S7 [Patescibacteria group bacterium]
SYLMKDGKKSIAQSIFYGAFDIIKEKVKDKDPLDVFDQAIKNASPEVEVRTKRVGGARYQVPREVRGERKIALASRWLIGSAKKKKGKPMAEKLAEEFMEAARNEGVAVGKKQETHKIADANKAFAHFRW